MTLDREWVQAQTLFYFGQLTSLVHKKGATRQDVFDLADEFTDKVMAESNRRLTANYERQRTPPG